MRQLLKDALAVLLGALLMLLVVLIVTQATARCGG